MSGAPDPRPARRLKAVPSEWERLRNLKLGPCRVCREPGTELHHLVPRGRSGGIGGDDVADNLVPLCRFDHDLIEKRDETASVKLGASLTPDECAYVIWKKGSYYLADRYRVIQRLGRYTIVGLELEAA